jgi:hypothetical protein
MDTEKAQLKQKLAAIRNLQSQYEKLKTDKQKIDTEIEPIKGYLEKTLVDTQLRKLEWEEFQVERVSKKQQRRPTLKMTYDAIQKILGPNKLEQVKIAVKELREKRKKTAAKKASLVIVKVGFRRKPRKDKMEESQLKKNKRKLEAPTEEKPKKKKFLKRTK